MTAFANINAVILAGGLGTRLRPVVPDRPKVLAMINNRPFLSYILDQIEEIGVQNVLLCTGFKGNSIYETFGNVYKSLHLVYSLEVDPLGTGGALIKALPLVNSD